jgi:hypothetical protein
VNINEVFSYMDLLSKLACNVCFWEICKTTSYVSRILDINKIDMMNPLGIFGEIYIHNYPEALKKFNYEIVENNTLSFNAFEQCFVSEHYFIHVHDKKVV